MSPKEPPIETIPVSIFKATCLAVVRRVERTGRPVLITRFGEPIAEVLPFSRSVTRGTWLGCMQGSVHALGDEVDPALDAQRWNALRP